MVECTHILSISPPTPDCCSERNDRISRITAVPRRRVKLRKPTAAFCFFFLSLDLYRERRCAARRETCVIAIDRSEEFKRISRKWRTSFLRWSVTRADCSAALVESPSSRRMVRRPKSWAIRISRSSYRTRLPGPASGSSVVAISGRWAPRPSR